MVKLDSVQVSTLMIISANAHTTEEPITSIGPRPISTTPRRRITRAPAKPIRIAVPRRRLTASTILRIASNVANTRGVPLSHTTVPRGQHQGDEQHKQGSRVQKPGTTAD